MSLVPDFVDTESVPPAEWPNSASTEFCCTENSCTASMGGEYDPLGPIWIGAPSSSRSFLVLVLPPTSIWDDDHMKNGFFSDVYLLTTAGSSNASVNGLRAFTGRSISILRSIVSSRVLVLNCSSTACAKT